MENNTKTISYLEEQFNKNQLNGVEYICFNCVSISLVVLGRKLDFSKTRPDIVHLEFYNKKTATFFIIYNEIHLWLETDFGLNEQELNSLTKEDLSSYFNCEIDAD